MSWISSLLGNLNYGTVFFLMMLESTVIPVRFQSLWCRPRLIMQQQAILTSFL